MSLKEGAINDSGVNVYYSAVDLFATEGMKNGYEYSYDLLVTLLKSEMFYLRFTSSWETNSNSDFCEKLRSTIDGALQSIIDDSRKPIMVDEISYFTGMTPTHLAIVAAKADLLTKFYNQNI